MKKFNSFALVKEAIKSYKFLFSFYILFNIIYCICNISIPFIIGKYIDYIVMYKNITIVIKFALIISINYILCLISFYIKNILFAKVTAKVSFHLTRSILNHVKKVEINHIQDYNAVYISDRINSDCSEITNFIMSNCIDVVLNILSIILYLCFLISLDFKLSIITFLFIPTYILLYDLYRKTLYKTSLQFKESRNKYFSQITKQLNNIKFIKLHVLFDRVDFELRKQFDNLYDKGLKSAKTAYSFFSLDYLIKFILNIIIFVYCGIKVIDNTLTLGSFTILNRYISMMFSSISYLLNLGQSYQNSLASLNRLEELLLLETEINADLSVDRIDSIEFNNVTFSYNSDVLLNDINLRFDKGNIYCIVGENGSGKSTLLNLACGLFNSYSGVISYNNKNIKNINLYETRLNLFGISEKPIVFLDLNISQNLYLDENNKEDVYNLIKIFSLDNIFNNTKENTCSDFQNNTFSEGEKQKLSLIRAIVKKPQVLILDEPSNALDKLSTEKLIDVLKQIKKDKIVIISSHDNALISIANEVIHLDGKF